MNENYLIGRLKNGENLNIVFMSHNAYWSQVEVLSDIYKNCKIRTFGKGISSVIIASFDENFQPIDDSDLIIYRSTDFEEYELKKMKELAYTISKNRNKPVTIGYSFLNPDYVKVDWHQEYIIKLITINDEKESEEDIKVFEFSPIELINYTLIKHDNIESKKYKKINRKN